MNATTTVTMFMVVGLLTVIEVTIVTSKPVDAGNTHEDTVLEDMDNTSSDALNLPHLSLIENSTDDNFEAHEVVENMRAASTLQPPSSSPIDPLQTADQIVREELDKHRRIERFKQTILEKLHLSAPPNITKPIDSLPEAVFQFGDYHQPNHHNTHAGGGGHHVFNDNLATEETKTSKLYLFADEEHMECDFPETSVCIRFPVTSRPKEQRLAAAQLWVYLTPTSSNVTTKRTLLVSLPAHFYGRRHTLATKDVYIREGWVELPLRHAIKRFQTSQHYIEITCKPNSLSGNTIQGSGSQRPIMVQTYALKNRERRGSNGRGWRFSPECNPDIDCCGRSFDINFSDMHWDGFIYYPTSYTANYCTGRCREDTPIIGEYNNHFSQVINTWIMTQRLLNRPVTDDYLSGCCVPTSLGSLNIIFQDADGTFNSTSLADMTAIDCHCIFD